MRCSILVLSIGIVGLFIGCDRAEPVPATWVSEAEFIKLQDQVLLIEGRVAALEDASPPTASVQDCTCDLSSMEDSLVALEKTQAEQAQAFEAADESLEGTAQSLQELETTVADLPLPDGIYGVEFSGAAVILVANSQARLVLDGAAYDIGQGAELTFQGAFGTEPGRAAAGRPWFLYLVLDSPARWVLSQSPTHRQVPSVGDGAAALVVLGGDLPGGGAALKRVGAVSLHKSDDDVWSFDGQVARLALDAHLNDLSFTLAAGESLKTAQGSFLSQPATGAAPAFATESVRYQLNDDGMLTLSIALIGDGGTDGTDNTTGAIVRSPYRPVPGETAQGSGYLNYTNAWGGEKRLHARTELLADGGIVFVVPTGLADGALSDGGQHGPSHAWFNDGPREIRGVIRYRAFTF